LSKHLPPGTKVVYSGGDEPEYGVVVHCWFDDGLGVHDCYIAFFGESMPKGPPSERPYILRYASTSLAEVE
jgi:hypothetical protein